MLSTKAHEMKGCAITLRSSSKPQSAAIWLPEPLRSKQKLGMAEATMATMLLMATMNSIMSNMPQRLQ